MITTENNNVRPHKLSPTSLTFDLKMFGFTSSPQTSHINFNISQSNFFPPPGFSSKTVNSFPQVVPLQSNLTIFQQNGQFWPDVKFSNISQIPIKKINQFRIMISNILNAMFQLVSLLSIVNPQF